MNRNITTIIMVFACLFCSKAFAIKQVIHVSPNATTFRVEPQEEDGMVRFTIVRDPADAQEPLNESLILVRSAQLRVSDGKRMLLTAPIAPRVNDDGKLVYVFRVSEEHAPHAVFTISEIENNRNGFSYIGGGAIYEYSIKSGGGIHEALRKLLGKNKDRPKGESDR